MADAEGYLPLCFLSLLLQGSDVMSSHSNGHQVPDGKPTKSAISWIWLSVLMIVLDLGSKALVRLYLGENDAVTVIPGFFDLRLLYNYGAAFSFLADHSGWQRWLFAIIAIAVVIGMIVWMMRMPRNRYWQAISAALVVGGALGNLYDRVLAGRVTDFLSFHWQNTYYYPAFNIADSAIVVGMLMLIWDSLRRKKPAVSDPAA